MTDANDSIPTTATKIEINLSRLPQLFNSLDPSPFLERDLDHDAEDYIVGSAEEAPRQQPLLTKDEARRIAANIAKLPELVRKD